jgi:hypothetical protein
MFSKMVCVVCPKGFELLSLDNLKETQIFPAKGDPDFAFLSKKADSTPVNMFKISADEFFMCYTGMTFDFLSVSVGLDIISPIFHFLCRFRVHDDKGRRTCPEAIY